MNTSVDPSGAGLGRLDRERAESLADEGGAAATAFEARDEFEVRDERGREGSRSPRLWPWAAGILFGFVAATLARRRRPRRVR